MSGFAIKYPFFIIVICLMVAIVGSVTLVRMPVDLFPPINIPVVVVATFYSGMPPEQIETDITGRFERFFTLASGIDHIESRSLPGVSLIKVYFQPGLDADAAVSTISNLAMADLRRLPPGTLPPVVLKFDASSLPVCLITLKGEGLNETQLRDLGQYNVRNQVANVPGASVPQPFGGRYRQIMVYVDPLKLEAHQLSLMDVVRTVNDSNLILPAGDVRIGNIDYNLYTNSQLPTTSEINALPLKTIGGASVLVGDVGRAQDAQQIQVNVVRVDGQKSVYLPVMKQGGDTNTIAVVNGIKSAVASLSDVPKQLSAKVVFDQSIFVKSAIDNLLHEGAIGLLLTGGMVLLFLGSMRATVAVFLCIPLIGIGGLSRHQCGRRHGQYDGAGRPCPGVFAANRQLGHRSRKHFPTFGNGRDTPGRGGKGRPGSGAGGSRCYPHDGYRFLSRHFPLWSEPVSFFGSGRRRGSFTLCLVFRRHDGCAFVLYEIHQEA